MKKLFVIIPLIFLAFTINAQVLGPTTFTSVTVDTVETLYMSTGYITGDYNYIDFQVLCTDGGGTPDGSIILQESVDGTHFVTSETADTLTITAGAQKVWKVANSLTDNLVYKYRLAVTGTASDTTIVTGSYLLRK